MCLIAIGIPNVIEDTGMPENHIKHKKIYKLECVIIQPRYRSSF